MGTDSTSGGPFDGGDPIDLDADRLEFGRADAALAARFRAGLEPDEGQARRVISRLPLIQAKARRSHRRRLALASGVAVLAVTAATALVATLPMTTGAHAVTPAGTSSPVSQPSPTYALPVTVLLPAAAITAFGDVRLIQSEGPDELGGQPLVAGVCVDAALPITDPDHGWWTGWRVADPPAKATVPPGLVEKVWRWADSDSAPALFKQLEEQVAGCSSGPGLSGRGVTRRLDPRWELSEADSVLLTTASDGQGNQEIQMVMMTEHVVVQVDAVLPDVGKNQQSITAHAEWQLSSTAEAALSRALYVTEAAAR